PHRLGNDLAERAVERGEVLREDRDRTTVDRPPAGDHRIAPRPALLHVEFVGPVAHEGVELFERAGVKEPLDALAGGELALRVLLLYRVRGGGVDRLLAELAKLGQLLLVRLGEALAHRPSGG